MKTLLLILLVAIGVMSSLYKRFKQMRTDNVADDHSYDSSQANESWFVDNDVQVEEMKQQPYFTYESVQSVVESSDALHGHEAVKDADPVVSSYKPQFDLRQAVIYQTLLDNKYINVVNQ